MSQLVEQSAGYCREPGCRGAAYVIEEVAENISREKRSIEMRLPDIVITYPAHLRRKCPVPYHQS